MEERELQRVILSELPEKVNLRPLSGFKLNFSANLGFQKVYFSARCDCETAALLSVEVSNNKSDREILDAIPSLVERLVSQERSFRGMDCSMHGMMRKGFIGGSQDEVGSPEES
ncbi:MAG: hypothetical protein VX869_05280 [Chloroflexota bacterium]|uniref:Uncharacterized protein n=1 Tax=marine metagenome TaxID=408172 RepID=A0A381VUY5_9ZZZZ|nr:hypothetical protein [Chloroflexota bacterium]MEC9321572.1 hypothetical protein [Chloroflexota bacterium]|tara:strand:+ start:1137 stop:1478 length:342 start_codon:yes stop_codon:yes gene_type:complete